MEPLVIEWAKGGAKIVRYIYMFIANNSIFKSIM